MKGIFIAFEGGEGSGKTTQIQILAKALEDQGRKIFVTKEPGGDKSICREIRDLLLDAAHKDILDDRAELFLFLADRAQHISKTIMPALESGHIVLCDRFAASTFAYQFFGRAVADFEFIKKNNEFASHSIVPDLSFYIDIDLDIGIKRKEKQTLSRIDAESMEFHKKVRKGFYDFFEKLKWPVETVDGSASIEHIHKKILERMENLFNAP